jgi:tRNA pseudouridine55 synthase
MDGIVIVNKPKSWTSFDVCAKIRRISGEKKVGHSGTLDPMATGVLPVFLGRSTKVISHFLNGDKGYEGEMVLGIKTDTGDAEGKTIPLPQGEGWYDYQSITLDRLRAVFKKYTGEIEQMPPMYSAVKVNGRRLYDLARQGIEIKREPRKVMIYELRLTPNPSPDTTNRRLSFYVLCSKGTYIRQLVADIGDDLGCGAHLSGLNRVYAHPFHIAQALEMDTIITLAGVGKLETVVIPPEEILSRGG